MRGEPPALPAATLVEAGFAWAGFIGEDVLFRPTRGDATSRRRVFFSIAYLGDHLGRPIAGHFEVVRSQRRPAKPCLRFLLAGRTDSTFSYAMLDARPRPWLEAVVNARADVAQPTRLRVIANAEDIPRLFAQAWREAADEVWRRLPGAPQGAFDAADDDEDWH